MPQATEALRTRWDHYNKLDRKAIAHLRQVNFTWLKGIIRPPEGYQPTSDDYSAIDYLCQEWDYGYDPSPASVSV